MSKENKKKQGTNHTPQKKEAISRITLKNWALEDRPREKLMSKGKKELSTAELLAILLGSGSVGQSAVELSKSILSHYGNSLSTLSRQGIKELTKNFKGIGEAKAITIIAALELGYRMLSESSGQLEQYLHDSQDCFNYISPSLIDLPIEEFWAIYLNNKNKILFKQRIASGSITETAVDLRKIFATAFEKNAVSIVVAHNHPSGDLTPSTQDKNLTHSIIEIGKHLHIKLLDHLIVGINGRGNPTFYSFHDNGLL